MGRFKIIKYLERVSKPNDNKLVDRDKSKRRGIFFGISYKLENNDMEGYCEQIFKMELDKCRVKDEDVGVMV